MHGLTLASVLTSAAELPRLEALFLQLSAANFYLPCAQRNCALFLSIEAMLLSLANTGYDPGIWSGVEQSAGKYEK